MKTLFPLPGFSDFFIISDLPYIGMGLSHKFYTLKNIIKEFKYEVKNSPHVI